MNADAIVFVVLIVFLFVLRSEFEGEVDGVAAVQVAGPVGGAGLHGAGDGLFLVKAALTGIAAGDQFGQALGSPQAA